MRVFVYGTLRRGQGNHTVLLGAQFLGFHRTEPVFRMLDLGPYPGVTADGATRIAGEVYGITPAILSRLDRLEDYPRTYDRQLLETPWGEAFIYLYRESASGLPTVASGDWSSYRMQRP